jgi:hypothetical protein
MGATTESSVPLSCTTGTLGSITCTTTLLLVRTTGPVQGTDKVTKASTVL